MVSRRDRRLSRLRKQRLEQIEPEDIVEESKPVSKDTRNPIKAFYEDQYKLLAIIPILLILFAIGGIAYNVATTGDFMNKGVSLKGGLTITVALDVVDIPTLRSHLQSIYPENDVVVRELSELGEQLGVIIEADVTDREGFVASLEKELGVSSDEFSIEEIGSSLGESFFRQTMVAVLIAFLFMGLVVFAYFRTFVPSMAVIVAAFSDIIVTLAIVDLMGMKIGTAGIAAFLMLIGYSVDTDILLSTRVLKGKEGTVMDKIYSAMRTGLTMNFTTIVAVSVALFFTDSEVIRQIMTIILVGLFVDIVMTWIQNVAILRYYLEKKKN